MKPASLFLGTALCALLPLAAAAQTTTADDDTIVVTGTALPAPKETLGSAVSILDGDEITLFGIDYLSDALRSVPGLSVTRTGPAGGLTQVRLRGSESNHVLVLLNGVEISPAGNGEVDLSSLLAHDIERVEIIRGPQSGLYGSNALAGVINVITSGGQNGTTARASIEAGSFDTRRTGLSLTAGDADRYIHASGSYLETEGFNAAPQGDEKDGNEVLSLLLRGAVPLGNGFSLDGFVRQVSKDSETDTQDFSGGPLQGLAIDSADTSETEDFNIAATVTYAPESSLWSARTTALLVETELTGGTPQSRYGDKASRKQLSAQVSRQFSTGARTAHSLTAFAEAEEETYRNTYPTDPSQEEEQSRSLAGAGLAWRVGFDDRLFLSATARHDSNDDFEDATTGSASLAWLLPASGTRLHASIGTGVTNPSFFEQFGFTPGTFVGNPDLKPEKAVGWDIGIEQSLFAGTTVIDATWFASTLEDEITAQFPTVVNQQGESDREGLELTLNSTPDPALTLAASYTYTDATDPDGAAEVRVPENAASLDVTWQASARATLSAGAVYNGERPDSDFRNFYNNGFMAERTLVDAYTLVHAAAEWQFTDQLALFARAENLLDTDYTETIGYDTPGQAFYIGIRGTLGRQ